MAACLQTPPQPCEIRVRAERRTGELLRETAKSGERATAKDNSRGGRLLKAKGKSTLSDHGISKDQSSDWQKLAAIPEKRKEVTHDRDLWQTGSPKMEAAACFAMIGKSGNDADSVRRLISVSDEEHAELAEWVRDAPALRGRIENMLKFRGEVLAEFEKLVRANVSAL